MLAPCASSPSIITFVRRCSDRRPHLDLSDRALERGVLDTATSVAQAGYGSVVRPACKLLLHGLREHRAVDVRVGGCFGGELAVEVRSIQLVNLENDQLG